MHETTSATSYDSFLLVSFGGPEGPDDVLPFLENVLRGKPVPRERMLEVAEHYRSFGGVSPINSQNRLLLEALKQEFEQRGIELPIYWGNRNWHPMLSDTLQQMKTDGCSRTLAFFTNMFSSYSGCRQYRENLAEACRTVGEDAPQIDKLRFGFNHPKFIQTVARNLKDSLEELQADPATTKVLFTAHSIPMSMADHCDYERQLKEASRLVAENVGNQNWELVYQSRSGSPHQPWLEPDVCDWITEADDREKLERLVVVPLGFVSDHMEVIYDLDHEAADLCKERGIAFSRSKTVGVDPQFVSMIADLIIERQSGEVERVAIGDLGPWHDVCPVDCCQYNPTRPARPSESK